MPDAPTPQRPHAPTRTWPQFSLRSLLLFVALAGSGYGLWYRWEPWFPGEVTHIENDWLDAMDSGHEWKYWIPEVQVFGTVFHNVIVTPGSAPIGKGSGVDRSWKFSLPQHDSLLHDSLARASRGRLTDLFCLAVCTRCRMGVSIHPRMEEFEDVNGGILCLPVTTLGPREWTIAEWQLRRPPEWYGIACLPEFWFTVILAVGLVWSLIRDRRMSSKFKVQSSRFKVGGKVDAPRLNDFEP